MYRQRNFHMLYKYPLYNILFSLLQKHLILQFEVQMCDSSVKVL